MPDLSEDDLPDETFRLWGIYPDDGDLGEIEGCLWALAKSARRGHELVGLGKLLQALEWIAKGVRPTESLKLSVHDDSKDDDDIHIWIIEVHGGGIGLSSISPEYSIIYHSALKPAEGWTGEPEVWIEEVGRIKDCGRPNFDVRVFPKSQMS